MNLGLVTLGCSKNQVDSEVMLGFFKSKGFNIVNNPEEAEVIVVNTCGFIESAKKEAIDTIFEMADYKQYGICKYLIVTGCLVKRYKNDILKLMPEVDLCIGNDEYDKFDTIFSDFFKLNLPCKKLSFGDRLISTKFPMAYVKISDGCDNRCTYCAIPSIRGNHRSRKIEDIVDEVKMIASQGISEICLIAQDTTKYGVDLYGKYMLAELIRKISEIEGIKWIKILYMYLYEVTDELIEEIKNNDKVAKYFDVPIQHIDDDILKAMNRHDTSKIIYDTIEKIRKNIPNAILRTTVITGFPGETEENFEHLYNAVKSIKFNRLGGFTYSQEEGTRSAEFKNQIDEKVKKDRLDKILKAQQEISLEKMKERIGEKTEVIVYDISEDEKYFVCRSIKEAPDVDGNIYIEINEETANKVVIGEYCNVQIIDNNEYDLFAKLAY